jgi:hypothetical protein
MRAGADRFRNTEGISPHDRTAEPREHIVIVIRELCSFAIILRLAVRNGYAVPARPV